MVGAGNNITLTRSMCAFFPVILPRYANSSWKDAISASAPGANRDVGFPLELEGMSTTGPKDEYGPGALVSVHRESGESTGCIEDGRKLCCELVCFVSQNIVHGQRVSRQKTTQITNDGFEERYIGILR